MTDYLPPPPAEIVIDPNDLLEKAFIDQGGNNHKFVVQHPDKPEYFETTVHNYNFHFQNNNRLSSQRDYFEDTLKDRVRDGDIDIDVARDLADCFGIELSRSVEYCVQVECTFTVYLPLDADPDDVVDNLNFEMVNGWGMEYDIDDSDYQVIYSQYTES